MFRFTISEKSRRSELITFVSVERKNALTITALYIFLDFSDTKFYDLNENQKNERIIYLKNLLSISSHKNAFDGYLYCK